MLCGGAGGTAGSFEASGQRCGKGRSCRSVRRASRRPQFSGKVGKRVGCDLPVHPGGCRRRHRPGEHLRGLRAAAPSGGMVGGTAPGHGKSLGRPEEKSGKDRPHGGGRGSQSRPGIGVGTAGPRLFHHPGDAEPRRVRRALPHHGSLPLLPGGQRYPLDDPQAGKPDPPCASEGCRGARGFPAHHAPDGRGRRRLAWLFPCLGRDRLRRMVCSGIRILESRRPADAAGRGKALL